jgi:hypothetical protein
MSDSKAGKAGRSECPLDVQNVLVRRWFANPLNRIDIVMLFQEKADCACDRSPIGNRLLVTASGRTYTITLAF